MPSSALPRPVKPTSTAGGRFEASAVLIQMRVRESCEALHRTIHCANSATASVWEGWSVTAKLFRLLNTTPSCYRASIPLETLRDSKKQDEIWQFENLLVVGLGWPHDVDGQWIGSEIPVGINQSVHFHCPLPTLV